MLEEQTPAEPARPTGFRRLMLLVVLQSLFEGLKCDIPNPAAFQFTPVAVDQNNASPTFIDDTGVEAQNLDYMSGLPTPDGDLFTVTSYKSGTSVTIRGYGRTGTLNLLYDSGWAGVGSISLKNTGAGYLLIYCKLYTSDASVGVRGHVATFSTNLISVRLAAEGADTSTRVTLVRDMPGTNYFFGASLPALHKYDVTTFTAVLNSLNFGSNGDYPLCLFYSQSTDTVFAWWISTSTLAVFSSSSFTTALTQTTASGYPFAIGYHLHQFVLNNLLDTDLMELRTIAPGTSCELGRRSLTSGGLIRIAGPSFSTFGMGMLINMGTIDLVGLAPQGSSASTVTAAKGTLILIKKLDLSIYATLTLPTTIDFKQMRVAIRSTSVELNIGGSDMHHVAFYHHTNFNFQTYYFLIDPCAGGGYVSCTVCPIEYWLADPVTYGTPGSCKLPEGIPAKNGMDNTTRVYKPCSVTDCMDCRYNYQICTECDASKGLQLVSNKCSAIASSTSSNTTTTNYDNLPKDSSLSQSGSFAAEASNLKITFTFDPQFLPDLDTVAAQLKIVDLVSGKSYSFKELNGQATAITRGFSVRISSTDNILSATATIEKSSTFSIVNRNTGAAFDSYPIEVGSIYLLGENAATQAATSVISGASNSRAAASLLLIASNPMASVFLDYLFSELFILKQYEGEFLVYPEIILRTTAQSSLLPFEVPNIFETEEDPECTPESSSLQQNEITCNTMNNFGEDAITLTGYFAVGGAISLLALLVTKCCGPKREGEEPSGWVKAVEWVNFSFGIKIFHAKMEGEKIEVIFHAFLGQVYRKQSVKQPINIIFVIILYIYYWTIGLMSVYFAAEVGRYLSKSPAVLKMLKEHNLAYLKELVEFEQEIAQDVSNPEHQNMLISARALLREVQRKTFIDLPKTLQTGVNQPKPRPMIEVLLQAPPQDHIEEMLEPRTELRAFHEEDDGAFNRRNPAMYSNKILGTVESQPSQPSSERELTTNRHRLNTLEPLASDQPGDKRLAGEIPEVEGDTPALMEDLVIKRAVVKTEVLSRAFTVDIQRLIKQKVGDLEQAIPAAGKKSLPKLEPFVPEAKEVIDLRSHEWQQLTFLVEDMTIPQNDYYKYTALAALFRCMLLALVLIRVTGQPRTQVTLGILVEAAFLWYMSISVCKAELTEYYVELAMQILRIAYLLLKLLASVDTIGLAFKQNYIGVLMAILLVLICLINILFMVYSVGEVLFELSKACWYKCRGRSEDSKDD